MKTSETQLPKNPASDKRNNETLFSLDLLSQAAVKKFDAEVSKGGTREIYAFQNEGRNKSKDEIGIDELYANPEFTSRELQTALRLLGETIQFADYALQRLRAKDNLGSHEGILSIQNRLPELFACRGLGDGYGALINSVQLALINRRGIPLTENQLLALKEILVQARKAPFIRFDKARKLVREFEKHDFLVQPRSLQFLLKFFDE